MAGGVVAFEGELNSIVREYLEFSEFDRTLLTFSKECNEKGKPVAQGDVKPTTDRSLLAAQSLLVYNGPKIPCKIFKTMWNELLRHFDRGERLEFFSMWKRLLPEAIRNEDTVAQKLEFYLYIYFAVFPMKYGGVETQAGMDAFKTYLETRGSTLSQTTEFLPFYALPFVPNPRNHPSYKELFTDKWAPDLKLRLERFLTLALKSTTQPRLFELYKGGAGRDVDELEQRVMEQEKKSVTYLKRYNRVQGDYHNLIGITADLVDSLERTVQGDPVTPEYLQKICMRLFSNQVRQSVDFTRPGTAGEVLRQSVVPPQGLQHNETAQASSLDYDKIKKDLTTASDRTIGLLLQALRWKLTKSAPPERDAMLTSYVENDLLGCARAGPHRVAVMKLLIARSEMVKQYTARLFNAFASLADGRSYLARNPELLRALMKGLRSDAKDSLTRENVLGCLQKLSLRRQLQSQMIEEGIIEWLVEELEDNDNLSDYTLEYSVALLMNLCLRTGGKKKCVQIAAKVLKVLSDLLGHDNQEIIPYVNGTLYSVLAIPAIREEAKAMGMEEILRCFIKEGQPDMNRQIEFIIKQLNSDEEPDDSESDDEDEEEDEEDQDAMEADLDKKELIKAQHGEMWGERLLNTHYVTSISPAHKKRVTDAASNQDDILRRPITPVSRRGNRDPVVHVQPKSNRPPSGRPRTQGGSRPSSRDINRPPTRSGGSRGSSRDGRKDLSSPSGPTAAEPKSNRASHDPDYQAAFNSRPRIPRTADTSGKRPTSKGSIGAGPTPRPEYSDSLPTSRPGSGGRPGSVQH